MRGPASNPDRSIRSLTRWTSYDPAMRAAALAAILSGVTLPAQSPTVWHTDLAAARQLAAKDHAPLLVVFRCER